MKGEEGSGRGKEVGVGRWRGYSYRIHGNEQCGNKFPFCARLMQISDTRRAEAEAVRGGEGRMSGSCMHTGVCVCVCVGVSASVALHAHTYKFNESHL